jgi:hypothetical protein
VAWITDPSAPVIEIGMVSLIGLARSWRQLVTESEEPESSMKDPVDELSGIRAVGVVALATVVRAVGV